MFLVSVFTVLEMLGKHGIVERFCGSFILKITLLHSLCYFYQPRSWLLYQFGSSVIPLLLVGFPFEIVLFEQP